MTTGIPTLDQRIPAQVLDAWVKQTCANVLPEYGFIDNWTNAQDVVHAFMDMSVRDRTHVMCAIFTELAAAKRAAEPPF